MVTLKALNNSQKPYIYVDPIPVAVDCIIFGFNENKLELLLIHRGFEPERGKWSLMGGFVRKDEDLNAAASRVLKELTGLENIYMEQLRTFGQVNRDSAERVISVAYFALIRKESYNKKQVEAHNAQWFPMNEIPEMIFDHQQMVNFAMSTLKTKVQNQPIGFNLLSPKFTLVQLQALYEAIFEEKLDKRNFRKKIISMNILEKLDEKDKLHSKKGAYLFKFRKDRYNERLNSGMTNNLV